MLPDRVSNPGPLTYESGALPIALRGPAYLPCKFHADWKCHCRFLINCQSCKMHAQGEINTHVRTINKKVA